MSFKNSIWGMTAVLLAGGCAATGQVQQAAVPALTLADGEAAVWGAGRVDREHLREGKPTRIWEHGKEAALALRTVPADWSAYNTLTFWLYSPKATDAKFMMIISSENPATEGTDYYSAPILVNFTGWKRFSYYLPTMGESREPLGWKRIGGLQFTATGWGNEPNPKTTISVGPLVLSKEEPRKGPRLSDQELFEALNLNYPGMETVAAAYKRGDMTATKRTFAEYLRRRQKPRWYFPAGEMANPRPQNPNLEAAERAIHHEMRSIGINHQFGPTIDWNFDVTAAPGSQYPANNEWTWQLNRHNEWVALSRAYRDTGDEKYAREWVAQMMQWVRDAPVPADAGNGARSAWRTIETGIRASGPWPEIFFRFLHSPSFTDEALITLVKSFVDHAEHLVPYPSTGNWLAMEANGLYHVGVLFPEFKEAPQWRTLAMKWLYAELDNQVYPDGVQIELASGYHHVSLDNFLGAFRVARLNDVAVPEDYLKRLQKMYEFDVYGAMPDRNLPALHDSGLYNVTRALREASTLFPDKPEYLWYATEGKEGKAPEHTSHAFPYAGYFMMRSGWERDANYLMFDGGPFGYGHQHEDKLNLIVHAYGKQLLVDPGNYQYERSKWRQYFIDSPAHNVVLVDGQPQRRQGAPREQYVVKEPLPHVWVTKPDYDYSEATFDENFAKPVAKNVSHTRRVLFVKPGYWVVCDTLTALDGKPHSYEALFHFDAPVQAEAAQNRVTTTNKDAANLAIHARPNANLQLKIVQGQQEPVQGWLPTANISSVRPAPVAVFQAQSGGAKETHLIWVLSPSRVNEQNPVLAVEAVTNNPLAARIRFRDGRSHEVAFSGGQAADLKAGNATGRGRVLLSETLQNGTAGRSIVAAP